MIFEDFIKKGLVRKASKDKSLAKALLQNSKKDVEFLNSLKINENSVRKIMVNFYDVLRSILEAVSIIKGYKIYSHEAYSYFLKEIKENLLAIKFDRFRKIRNSINYYGKDISIKEAKENVDEIMKMVNILIKKYLGKLE